MLDEGSIIAYAGLYIFLPIAVFVTILRLNRWRLKRLERSGGLSGKTTITPVRYSAVEFMKRIRNGTIERVMLRDERSLSAIRRQMTEEECRKRGPEERELEDFFE